MIFDSLANKPFELEDGIAYFCGEAPAEKAAGAVEAFWRGHVSAPIVSHISAGERIVYTGRTFLEIGAGYDGGFTYYILKKDRDANLIISDKDPVVVGEWKHFFKKGMRPQNITYAVLDACSIPFKDNSVDVISWHCKYACNFLGDKAAALNEIYRVLRPGGMFVTSSSSVKVNYAETLPQEAYEVLSKEYPCVFNDYLNESYDAGFKHIENIEGSVLPVGGYVGGLADLCVEHGVILEFSTYLRFCYKGTV